MAGNSPAAALVESEAKARAVLDRARGELYAAMVAVTAGQTSGGH